MNRYLIAIRTRPGVAWTIFVYADNAGSACDKAEALNLGPVCHCKRVWLERFTATGRTLITD